MAETEKPDTDCRRRIPELRYAYYIRCERMKDRGGQCKAPALKGTRVCYKHTQRDEAKRKREEMIRALELPPLIDVRRITVALSRIAQALIDDRIDERAPDICFTGYKQQCADKSKVRGAAQERKN